MMRLLTLCGAAGIAAAVCSDRSSCLMELEGHARKMPALKPVFSELARMIMSVPHEVLLVDAGSTDSKWCPNSSYWELMPAPVGNVNVTSGSGSTSWSGDGCFTTMSASATTTASGATVTLTGSGATSLLCSDYYVVSTSYGVTLASVGDLTPSTTVSMNWTSASDALDASLNGLNILLLPCGLVGTVNSLLKTVSLFDGNSSALITNNIEFLTERKVWPAATPFNKVVAVDQSNVKSGDYLAITRLDGLDPMIMFGTGGVTGHSALAVWDPRDGQLYVCESTDANPLGPVYWPPPYGIIRHTYAEWVTLAQAAGYSVALLPIQDQYSSQFNETAYWAWFEGVQGMPYGYHSMLMSFLDTGGDNFANMPLPVTNPVIPPLLSVLDMLLPNSSAGVSVFSMFTWGLNKRLNASCNALSCIIDIITANKAANRFPSTLTDALAMPDQDVWKFGANYSLVCSEFAARGWKAGLQSAFPVWNSIQAGEQTPKDNYQMALYDPARFDNTNCPGGVMTDPTGNGTYCQILGPYVLYLNGYNSVPLYPHINERCPSQWPSYERCPADNPTCC